jgi:hypothetical protein
MSETNDYLDNTRHLNASQKALFNAQSRSRFPVPPYGVIPPYRARYTAALRWMIRT